MFQKRHYEAIADLINQWTDENHESIEEFPILRFFKQTLVSQFIDLFAEDNPNFDHRRFREATQTEEYK